VEAVVAMARHYADGVLGRRSEARDACGTDLRPEALASAAITGRSQRRRRYPPRLEDCADRGCSDAVAEFGEFTLDALVAQVWFSRAICCSSVAG
jgi:hypothetical protein